MNRSVELEKPVYSLGVAAEMLGSHPRMLVLSEEFALAARSGGPVKRLRYSLRDVIAFRALSRLRRRYEMNVAGARDMIRCLQLLDAHHIPRPLELRGIDLDYVSV